MKCETERNANSYIYYKQNFELFTTTWVLLCICIVVISFETRILYYCSVIDCFYAMGVWQNLHQSWARGWRRCEEIAQKSSLMYDVHWQFRVKVGTSFHGQMGLQLKHRERPQWETNIFYYCSTYYVDMNCVKLTPKMSSTSIASLGLNSQKSIFANYHKTSFYSNTIYVNILNSCIWNAIFWVHVILRKKERKKPLMTTYVIYQKSQHPPKLRMLFNLFLLLQ